MTLQEVKQRNVRVEADKAWETSGTRKVLVAVITYVVVVVFLLAIGAPRPYVSALIPALGFLLSTLTLPFAKKVWLAHCYKR